MVFVSINYDKVYPASGRRSSKRVPWSIWIIIGTPHPVCRKRRFGGASRVVRYKLSSNKTVLELGYPTNNSPVVGGAPGYGFHPSHDPSGSDDPARFRVCAVPIMAYVGNHNPLPIFPVLRVLFRVSSVFWLFFQANLILINHPHRPSLAKVSVQKGGRKTFNKSKLKCYHNNDLNACIMVFYDYKTLNYHASNFVAHVKCYLETICEIRKIIWFLYICHSFTGLLMLLETVTNCVLLNVNI